MERELTEGGKGGERKEWRGNVGGEDNEEGALKWDDGRRVREEKRRGSED